MIFEPLGHQEATLPKIMENEEFEISKFDIFISEA